MQHGCSTLGIDAAWMQHTWHAIAIHHTDANPCVDTHTHVHTQTHKRTLTDTHTYTIEMRCNYLSWHAHIHTHLHTHSHAHVYMCMYATSGVDTHTHTHTNTHTHMYVYIPCKIICHATPRYNSACVTNSCSAHIRQWVLHTWVFHELILDAHARGFHTHVIKGFIHM